MYNNISLFSVSRYILISSSEGYILYLEDCGCLLLLCFLEDVRLVVVVVPPPLYL